MQTSTSGTFVGVACSGPWRYKRRGSGAALGTYDHRTPPGARPGEQRSRSHVEEAAQASAGCYFFDHTTFTSTPEPSTVVLSVTGLMLIAGRAWRKRTPFERIVIFPILHWVHRSNHSAGDASRAFVICSGVHRFITRIAELGTGECWRKGLLASRIFIPPEVYLQVRSPACVRLSFC
jgi:hypothetical protein